MQKGSSQWSTYNQQLSSQRSVALCELPERGGKQAEGDGQAPLDDDKADIKSERAEGKDERENGHGQEIESE